MLTYKKPRSFWTRNITRFSFLEIPNPKGGIHMSAEQLWKLFCQTGLPVCYTLYCRAKQIEERNVANQTGKTA